MAKKTMRERWAESFRPNEKELWLLEEHGDTALFISKDKPNDDRHGRQPMYHVWKGEDNWLYCGPALMKAVEIYTKAIKED